MVRLHAEDRAVQQVVKTDDTAKQKAAKVHLTKAINRFREAVNLAPDNVAARLGYAWTLDQAGHTKEAITQYRSLIEDAWKNEQHEGSLPMNGETVVIGGRGLPHSAARQGEGPARDRHADETGRAICVRSPGR